VKGLATKEATVNGNDAVKGNDDGSDASDNVQDRARDAEIEVS